MTEDGRKLPVSGWLAMARDPYKYDEHAGVRIYARNKIVALTRDFERKSGFTGEFATRSYLVGEVYAEWLDEDEDLIRSDRQGIIWDSDYGRALRDWGGELIKKIGELSSKPRRDKTKKRFLSESNFVELAKERFSNESIVDVAIDLAEKIGGFADEDELGNKSYVADLCEVILTVAPHKALIDAFQEFNKAIDAGEQSVEQIVDLFDKTRIAEMASYARIADERVQAINKLQHIVITEPDESKFQELLADASWLIHPTWSVISENQALTTTKELLEAHIKKEFGVDVVFATGFGDFKRKRPDFTLANIEGILHVVEIKKSGHSFDDTDFGRLANYPIAFDQFFEENPKIKSYFPEGWRITLVADGENLKIPANVMAYRSLKSNGKVLRLSWKDFLFRARVAHEEFLNVAKKVKKTSKTS
jgi:hypothetical protein